jgi:hypothetical protein
MAVVLLLQLWVPVLGLAQITANSIFIVLLGLGGISTDKISLDWFCDLQQAAFRGLWEGGDGVASRASCAMVSPTFLGKSPFQPQCTIYKVKAPTG